MDESIKAEIAALTPRPEASERWTQAAWALHYRGHANALHDRLLEVQALAGVRDRIERLERGPLFPHIDGRPYNPNRVAGDQKADAIAYREGLRRVYFEVMDMSLRRRLIALERASETTSLRFHEAEIRQSRDRYFDLRKQHAGWGKMATIEAVALVLLGSAIGLALVQTDLARQVVGASGAQVGAVVGAVVGVIGALQRRDRAHEADVDARRVLDEEEAAYQALLDEPDVFSSREEYTAEPDRHREFA